MPTPQFVLDLRSRVGTEPLWLSTAVGVVLDTGGRVLLGRRSDTGEWCLPGGIIDPAEQPADAAIREVYEETAVAAIPEALTSIGVSPPWTYGNGDRVQYLEYTFRCRAVGGSAQVSDGEMTEVAWHAADRLPALRDYQSSLLATALRATATQFTFSGLDQVLGPEWSSASPTRGEALRTPLNVGGRG
jgi:8-oxo-dGTP pyrophosphatase MutT (NUDIX family)